MSYFSSNPSHCRVDFFKENGKWYDTEQVVFGLEYYTLKDGSSWEHPINKFKKVLKIHLRRPSSDGTVHYRMRGMIAVCLDPYFEGGAWPLLVRIPEEGEW